MRAVPILVLLLLLAGPAAATPIATIAVGPDGLEGSSDPYYVKVGVSTPETPHAGARSTDDCAASSRPANALVPLLAEGSAILIAVSSFPSTLSIHGIVPGCVATPPCLPGGLCPAYVSYDVNTGRYYVEEPASGIVIFPQTGTDGVEINTDCNMCPPPTCC